MELLRVSENKLKITLEREELRKYRIEDWEVEHPHTRRAIRQILTDAERMVGFPCPGEQVLLQLFPSKDGGCELFVTLLEESPSPPPRDTQAHLQFESLQALLDAATLLDERGYGGESALYQAEGRWILSVEQASEHPFLGEFYQRSLRREEWLSLAEYALCLIPNGAISLLKDMK